MQNHLFNGSFVMSAYNTDWPIYCLYYAFIAMPLQEVTVLKV